MTIQNAPPGLDYERDKKFSKVLLSSFGPLLSEHPLHPLTLSLMLILLYILLDACLIMTFPVVISLSKKWLLCVW